MSEQETMRLVAEVVDKYSGPLKEMQKSLRELAGVAKGTHESAGVAAREHAKHVRELHERLHKMREAVTGAVTPALASMGITVFGVGEGLSKLVDKLRTAGESYNKFREAAARGGVSAGFVGTTVAMFRNLGLSADSAMSSVSNLGDHLAKIARGSPDELNGLNNLYSNLGDTIAQTLQGAKTSEERISRLLTMMKQKNYPVDQQQSVLRFLGVDPALAIRSLEEMEEARKKALDFEKNHPTNMRALKELDETFTNLRTSLEGFSADMVEAFGGPAIKVIEGFDGALKRLSTDMTQEFSDASAIMKVIRSVLDFDQRLTKSAQGLLTGGPGFKIDPFASMLQGKLPEKVQEGAKQGILEGLREQRNDPDFAKAAAGGYMPMAYHPDGGVFGTARKAFRDGGGFRVIPDGGGSAPEGSNAAKGLGGVDLGGGVGGGLNGSAYLKAHRQQFADAMKANPQLRKQIAGMMLLEGAKDPVPVVESLMNRAEFTGKSLNKLLHSGFYGPINRGQLPGAMARLEHNPKLKARMDAAIDAALAGSNTIKGATDQGMLSDPNGRYPGGRIFRGGQVFNDYGGGPGGHEGARRFREAQQRAVNSDLAQIRNSAHLRDMVSRGRSRFDGSLLKSGKQSGMLGGGDNKVTGDASVRIDLNGFPKGTRTRASANGVFKEVQLNRGRPMGMANQDS